MSARDLLLEHFRWIDGHADVWAVFRDAEALRSIVAGLVEPFRDQRVTAICGIESRGFLLGGAAAVELGVGFVPVRKGDGVFPGEKIVHTAGTDYRRRNHTLRVQRSSLRPADRVLLVDDWIETGSQALATRHVVERCGSTWVGCSVLVDELRDDRRGALGPVTGLINAGELPPIGDGTAAPGPRTTAVGGPGCVTNAQARAMMPGPTGGSNDRHSA